MLQKLTSILKRIFSGANGSDRGQASAVRRRNQTRTPVCDDQLREVAVITDAEGQVIYVESQGECAEDPVDEVLLNQLKRRFNKTNDQLSRNGNFWGLVLSKKVHRRGFLEHKRKGASNLDTKLIRALIDVDRDVVRSQVRTKSLRKGSCKE